VTMHFLGANLRQCLFPENETTRKFGGQFYKSVLAAVVGLRDHCWLLYVTFSAMCKNIKTVSVC
jgi:hypothetical protein